MALDRLEEAMFEVTEARKALPPVLSAAAHAESSPAGTLGAKPPTPAEAAKTVKIPVNPPNPAKIALRTPSVVSRPYRKTAGM